MSGGASRNLFWVTAAALGALFFAPGLVRASPVLAQEPVRCAPCSAERLAACPPVDPLCHEVLPEPGCGCCPTCALKKGDACGIYTAPCGSGTRCLPRPGEPRPLHALTRGQAMCTELDELEQNRGQDLPESETENRNGATAGTEVSSPLFVPVKHVDPRLVAGVQESMKSKGNSIRRKLVEQGPCHIELQRALDKINKSQQKMEEKLVRFYLPNCDKHGLYKPKQCESSLDGQKGKCWCVSTWNGKIIVGPSELPTDAECPVELNH